MDNEVIRNIKCRRSIRKYQDRKVSGEIIDMVLEAASFAPSGHNEQPWHFIVIRQRPLIEELDLKVRECMVDSKDKRVSAIARDRSYRVFFNAPVVIIVSGDERGYDPEDHLEPFADCCAAIENILLAANSLGIGSCWVGFARYLFKKREIRKILPVPAGFRPYYAVCLGYADPSMNPACPERKERRIFYLD